ncbi:hypothetical protein ACFO5X_11155 [Seohaeicola nanhaiensis]|uniref:Capsular biosynthesis protein n=1 Tax=Seohaeicola nanhaiensis TaxID=1387282 RepID=A0ABV9KGN3_9RHOB
MSNAPVLRFYLHEALRRRAANGGHNFISRIAGVAARAGFRVEYLNDGPAELLSAPLRDGYAMLHMAEPGNDRTLTMRKVYEYPFWSIEKSARRWDWTVARTPFPAGEVHRAEADRFYGYWRNRLFREAPEPRRDGICYVPLQGRLLEHRSFQSCSPVDMLRAVLAHDDRPVVATLHPKETYSQPERDALVDLARAHPRLDLRTGGMEGLLADCDYVVTQNSSVAFLANFFAKPSVLFGRIDFHHIAANVHELGVEAALALGPTLTPDYAGYVHWFWQTMSINAGKDTVDMRIAAILRAAGWPV